MYTHGNARGTILSLSLSRARNSVVSPNPDCTLCRRVCTYAGTETVKFDKLAKVAPTAADTEKASRMRALQIRSRARRGYAASVRLLGRF